MKKLILAILFGLFMMQRGIAQRFDPDYKLPLGIGIAAPHMIPGRPFYFYSAPDFDAVPLPSNAIDSITFVKGKYCIDIATAPPWLAPEYIKLDYDIFLFRVVTYSQNWIEVIVNTTTGQTSWVDGQAIAYREWGTFLTGIVAVEVIDIEKNPIRLKPLDHSSILAQVPGAQLRPIAVQGDWLLVSSVGLADRIVPTGWIRWRRGGQLMITYSMLS